VDPQHWQRVRAVFFAICDLEPAARQRALEAACANDPALRAEVESLVRASESASGILKTPLGSAPLQGTGADPAVPPYTHIGPYPRLSADLIASSPIAVSLGSPTCPRSPSNAG
jgi:hypothetical protein